MATSAHAVIGLTSNCIVLYTFIWRFLLCTPIRGASSARDPERARKQVILSGT